PLHRPRRAPALLRRGKGPLGAPLRRRAGRRPRSELLLHGLDHRSAGARARRASSRRESRSPAQARRSSARLADGRSRRSSRERTCPRFARGLGVSPSGVLRRRFQRGRSVSENGAAALRIPPQSLEAEEAVLGGILLDNRSLDRANEILTADDFYRE